MLPAALRRWLHRPKRSDPRLLSQFFHADERVTRVVMEINSLDVETDPQQYLVLLNQLHLSQAHLLALLERLTEECVPAERHCRDYLAKFPEELLVDSLGNHLLFAAECLVAGTVLELDEAEGLLLRPLARSLLCSLQLARKALREQSLRQGSPCSEPVRMALIRFDTLFAEFQLSYVSALVALRTPAELFQQQEIVVLFCETVARALTLGYLSQEMIDGCEPLLMFTIPRLAIVSGLLIYPEGPLSPERPPEEMSRVFSPFRGLLTKIRALLRVLSTEELALLERSLCAAEWQGPCPASPDPRPSAHGCSPHPPAAAGAPGTGSGATHRGWGEAAQPVPPGSDRGPERPPSGGTGDDAACTRSASTAGHQGGPGPAGGARSGTRRRSAGPEGPPWDSSQQAPAASRPQEPTPPGARVETGWARLPPPRPDSSSTQAGSPLPPPGSGYRPELPVRHTAAPPRNRKKGRGSPRPLGPEPGCAGGRALPGAVLSVHRAELRARYSSTQDMLHTLFVCISGVADQLQTNFASELRSILKTVFHLLTSQPQAPAGTGHEEEEAGGVSPLADCALCSNERSGTRQSDGVSRLPIWVPDATCSRCTACGAPFTVVRRRHHCRSCGKIFCSRCSQHTAPLPHYGLLKPVRVCAHCYTTHLPASPPAPSHP